jgi:hypothetical protein
MINVPWPIKCLYVCSGNFATGPCVFLSLGPSPRRRAAPGHDALVTVRSAKIGGSYCVRYVFPRELSVLHVTFR